MICFSFSLLCFALTRHAFLYVPFAEFVDKVKAAYLPSKVKDGIFGAKMEVSLINDGPVTVVLNSSRGRSTTSMRASSFKPLQKRTRCFFRSGYRCIRSTRLFALTM